MSKKLKIAILIIVVLIFGANFVKNSKIEAKIENGIEEINKREGVTLNYKRVSCSGWSSIDCEIDKIDFIEEIKKRDTKDRNKTIIMKNQSKLEKVKFYNVEQYKNLNEKNILNRDIDFKIDFIGYEINEKDFIEGIQEKALIELYKEIYKNLNHFNTHIDLLVNLKSKEGDFNKFEIKNLLIDANKIAISMNLKTKNFSINRENYQNTIIQESNIRITNHNFKAIFIKWLKRVKKKYPEEYEKFCKIFYLNPEKTSPLKLYERAKSSFIADELNPMINRTQFTSQKEILKALKLVLEEKANSINIEFKNRTSITIGKFLAGVMIRILTNKNSDKFIFDNIDIKVTTTK